MRENDSEIFDQTFALMEKVKNRESFIDFVKALAEERKVAQKMENENSEQYIVDGPLEWANADISSFLNAALFYFEPGTYHSPEKSPSWKMFAEFLYFGKVYE